MSDALSWYAVELDQLGSLLGFPLVPDTSGSCALKLNDGMVVVMSFSRTSDRLSFSSPLIQLPQVHQEALFEEALRLNLHLARDEEGMLVYEDDSNMLVYWWNGRARSLRSSLQDTLLGFIDCARQVQSVLLAVRDHTAFPEAGSFPVIMS